MTDSEKLVNEVLAKEPFVLELKPSKRQKKFTDMASYGKFVDREVESWRAVIDSRPNPGMTVFNPLVTANTQLQNAQNAVVNDPNTAISHLRSSIQQLQQFQLFSETPEGQFVAGQLQFGSDRFHGALFYLFPRTVPGNIGNYSHEVLKGWLAAYFKFQVDPTGWSTEAVAAFERQQRTLDNSFDDIQERFANVTSELDQGKAVLSNQFTTLSTELNTFRDQWKQQIETLHKDATDRVQQLEDLYGEKLRLQGPAEYWQKLTKRYRSSGILWSVISGLLVVIGSVAGIRGLSVFQDAIKAGQTVVQGSTVVTTDWSHVLPVTIVFGVIISVWVFVIRTTVRLALSGFHLVRDAVEREQLSHYYLALIAQDKTLNKEAQNIVLQSLFSRAETGLLRGESGPKMPGGLEEILRSWRGS